MNSVTKHFEHLKLQLEDIKSATNNFADSNCIGQGGFGKVYKEINVVAIKRLDRAFGQGNPEFWKEITTLSIYKHKNIVSLLGFCDENDEKILVYEYASKTSLDKYLNNGDLTWVQRLKICIDAARGLSYFHNPGGSQQRVLHRDIKSFNILLDDNWNVRISDLGLSKFGSANQKYIFLLSISVGTIGYCDPLYVETGLLTKESDVYSFGVVLFEVLCGRLCVDINNKKRQPFTGLRDLEERPLMTKVVEMLENALKYQMQGPTNMQGMQQQQQYPFPSKIGYEGKIGYESDERRRHRYIYSYLVDRLFPKRPLVRNMQGPSQKMCCEGIYDIF